MGQGAENGRSAPQVRAAPALMRCAVAAVCLGAGWCQADDGEPEGLQLALSSTPSPLVPQRWRPTPHAQPAHVMPWHRPQLVGGASSLIRQREATPAGHAGLPTEYPAGGLVLDQRFIGLQLDNGARVGLRRANGRPTLYYRAPF